MRLRILMYGSGLVVYLWAYIKLQLTEEHSFKDQLTRAGLSIASNIAEGYERDSIRARLQYLKTAKGSYGEV